MRQFITYFTCKLIRNIFSNLLSDSKTFCWFCIVNSNEIYRAIGITRFFCLSGCVLDCYQIDNNFKTSRRILEPYKKCIYFLTVNMFIWHFYLIDVGVCLIFIHSNKRQIVFSCNFFLWNFFREKISILNYKSLLIKFGCFGGTWIDIGG